MTDRRAQYATPLISRATCRSRLCNSGAAAMHLRRRENGLPHEIIRGQLAVQIAPVRW